MLLSYGLELRDAILHAIQEENVQAVELLLIHVDQTKQKKKTKDLSVRMGGRGRATFTLFFNTLCD